MDNLPVQKKAGLGRGLSSLFDPNSEKTSLPSQDDSKEMIKSVPLEDLYPSMFQPRQNFSQENLDSLAQSIQTHGILQPLIVRQKRTGEQVSGFEIIAGERRWRAAQKAGLKVVPVIVKALEDQEALRIALIENIQREDLTAIEEAEGYKRLLEEGGYTQEELATLIGKSRSHIANMLRLNSLPDAVKEMVVRGELTPGHVRALLTSEKSEELAHHIRSHHLSVRQTENLIQKLKGKEETAGTPLPQKRKKLVQTQDEKFLPSNPELETLENHLKDLFGLKTRIQMTSEGEGQITLYFENYNDLDDLFNKLTGLTKDMT